MTVDEKRKDTPLPSPAEKEHLTGRASAECVFCSCAHRIYVLADAYIATRRYALRSR